MGFDWWMAWLVGLVCVSVSLLAHFDLPNVRARPKAIHAWNIFNPLLRDWNLILVYPHPRS
jgi:hypothetical protein